MELICAPYSMQGRGENELCVVHWDQALKATVDDVSLRTTNSTMKQLCNQYAKTPVVPSYGRLRNGMPYFIDHILLYSDGFTQYKFKQGSAGGVYCISLNYPQYLRRNRDTVRVLSLTPPGIATKEGLRSIIPDLAKSCTEGRVVRNADGEQMLLFTDIVGYVADYPEVTSVLDAVGHNGMAPCHLCSFLRLKGHHSSGTQYGHMTTTHSADACYAKTADRVKALRTSSMSDRVLVTLGLNPKIQAETKASPLFELYEAIREKMKTTSIPRTDQNVPVVSPSFDPYRSVFVAPDHLLAGIAINELTIAFQALPNVRRRKQADSLISHLLRFNGLPQESKVYNFKSKVLYSTSISGTFSILIVAAPAFEELIQDISWPTEMCKEEWDFLREIVENLCLFRKLVSRTYWYPRHGVDDPRSVSSFNRGDGIPHIVSLQYMCTTYMTKCNNICKRSRMATEELDKPNLHRLLELYHHSIPAAGHVQHFAELVFECAQQPRKRSMAKSSFRDSHVQSMKNCIGDDWKHRLAAAYASENELEVTKCLSNMFCGRDEEIWRAFQTDSVFRDTLKSLSRNEVLRNAVGKALPYLDIRSRTTLWYLREPCDTSTENEDPSHKKRLSKLYDVQDVISHYFAYINEGYPKFYEHARRVTVQGSGRYRNVSHPQGHDCLVAGMVVQALVSDLDMVVLNSCETQDAFDSRERTISHFVIECFVHISPDSSYAAVRNCLVTHDGLLSMDSKSRIYLLEMTDAVRRTALVHASHNDSGMKCFRAAGSSVSCTASGLNGNCFHRFSREDGYPPRLA